MNNTISATHIDTDQNWQDETTIYWFEVNGHASGFGIDINGTYGWSDTNGNIKIVDEDNCPLTDGDGETEAVRQAIEGKAAELTKNPEF